MDKNKSIDGLVSRSEKIALANSTHIRKNTAKNTTKVKTSAKPAKENKPAPKRTSIPVTTAPSLEPEPTPDSEADSMLELSPDPSPESSTESAPNSCVETDTNTDSENTTNPAPTEAPSSSSADAAIEDFLKPVRAFDFDEQSGELTEAKAPEQPLTKNQDMNKEKPLKPKASKKKKIITSVVVIIVLLILGIGASLVLWGNDIIAKITGGHGNIFDLLTFIDDHYEPLKTDSNGRTNILALGTSGYNMDGDEGNGTHDGAQLTDSIMVISLDQKTGDFAMLSLPRDLKASPTCTATGKINEVYWCNNMDGNNEAAGTTALMLEVGDILGLDFQYYAHINWGSLIRIVDILDGITVNLDEDIYDYYYTGAVFEAGIDYIINGEEALGLARARHGTAGGDFSRGASQQKILVGIKNRIFEKKLSLTDIISLASTLGDDLRTNFSVEEIKTLAHLSTEFDFNAMRQISLIDPEPLMTTGIINEISYVIPSAGANNYFDIQNYIEKMLSSDPKVYEDASILVLNGINQPGIASTEQIALETEGYNRVFIGDAPAGEYSDKYSLYVVNESKPGTKSLLETKYNTTASLDLPEGIERDYDFVLILGGIEDEPEETTED